METKGIATMRENMMTMKMQQDPMASYSLAEAAEILGVTDRTLRNYIARGKLPAYRIGARVVRVRRTDLESLFHRIPVASGNR